MDVQTCKKEKEFLSFESVELQRTSYRLLTIIQTSGICEFLAVQCYWSLASNDFRMSVFSNFCCFFLKVDCFLSSSRKLKKYCCRKNRVQNATFFELILYTPMSLNITPKYHPISDERLLLLFFYCF